MSMPQASRPAETAELETLENGILKGWAKGCRTLHVFANGRVVGRLPLPQAASGARQAFAWDARGLAPSLLLSDTLAFEIRGAPEGQALASLDVAASRLLARPAPRAADGMEGYIDECEGGKIRGWVWSRAEPFRSLPVHIFIDGRFAGRFIAGEHRPDLAALGKGEGRHGFRADVTEFFRALGSRHPQVEVITQDECWVVPFAPHAAPASAPPPARRPFWKRRPRIAPNPASPRDFAADMAAVPAYPKKVFDIAAVADRKMPDPFAADYTLLALEFLRREAVDLSERLQSDPARHTENLRRLRALEQQLQHLSALGQSIVAAQALAALPARHDGGKTAD